MEQQVAPNSRISGTQVLLYVLTVAWAALIFYLSTATFGTEFSESLLGRELAIFHFTVSAMTFQYLDTLQRKIAHMIVYGVFAALLYGTLGTHESLRQRQRRMIWCVLIAGAYALTDEYHQSFVPGRNASIADCGIDIAGATFSLLIVNQCRQVLQKVTRTVTFL